MKRYSNKYFAILIFSALLLTVGCKNVVGKQVEFVWKLDESIWQFATGNDFSLLATKELENEVTIRDTRDGRLRYTLKVPANLVCMAFDATNRLLVSAHHSPWEKDRWQKTVLNIWSVEDNKLVKAIEVPTNPSEIPPQSTDHHAFPPDEKFSPIVRKVAFTPDGGYLAAAIDSGVFLWQMPEGKLCRFLLIGHVATFSFSPDGRMIAIGTSNSSGSDDAGVSVFLFHVSDGKMLFSSSHNTDIGPTTCIQFSPDGDTVISANRDAGINFWSVPDGHLLKQIQPRKTKFKSVAFSPNGNILAVVSVPLEKNVKSNVQLWSVGKKEKPLFEISDIGSDVSDLFFVSNELLGVISLGHEFGVLNIK